MVIVTSRIFAGEDHEAWDYKRSFMSCFSEVVGTYLTGILADLGRVKVMSSCYLLAGVNLFAFTYTDLILLCVVGRGEHQ